MIEITKYKNYQIENHFIDAKEVKELYDQIKLTAIKLFTKKIMNAQ